MASLSDYATYVRQDSVTPPTVRDTSMNENSASATSKVITAPTLVEGDFLVAIMMYRTGTGGLTAPSGWTLYQDVTHLCNTYQNMAVYTKVATASEPSSYTWTWTTSDRVCGMIFAVTGASYIKALESVTSTGNADFTITPDVEGDLKLIAHHWVYTVSPFTSSLNDGAAVEVAGATSADTRIIGAYTYHSEQLKFVTSVSASGTQPTKGGIAVTVA